MHIFTSYLKIIFISIALFLTVSCEKISNDKNHLVLGISPDYQPFEYKKDGELLGFDIDLAKLIAKEVGFTFDVVELDFASIIPALKVGKIDFAMSGLSATEARKQQVDFSTTYYDATFALILPVDSKIKTLADLQNKKIGAQLGSTMESFLKAGQEKYQLLEIDSLGNNMLLMQQLELRRIDGLMVEEIQANSFIKNKDNLKYISLPSGEQGYSVAFEKESPLKEKFNAAIAKLKKEGKIQELKNKWFDAGVDRQSTFIKAIKYIPFGMVVTLKYAVISAFLGLIVGTFLSVLKVSRFFGLRMFADLYTSIFRGTPLLVQLSLVYFVLPKFLGFELSVFASGVIAFSLNSGAYVSEIIRSGIESVDKGQFEAAKALGVPYSKMMKDIIMPQAIRNILPSLVNEVINLLKESAIISMIGEVDLMKRAQIVAAEQYSYLEPIIVAGICYYILVNFFSFLAKILEKRLKIK